MVVGDVLYEYTQHFFNDLVELFDWFGFQKNSINTKKRSEPSDECGGRSPIVYSHNMIEVVEYNGKWKNKWLQFLDYGVVM